MVEEINILRVIAQFEPGDVALLAREPAEKCERIAAHSIEGRGRSRNIGTRCRHGATARGELRICHARGMAAMNNSGRNAIPSLYHRCQTNPRRLPKPLSPAQLLVSRCARTTIESGWQSF